MATQAWADASPQPLGESRAQVLRLLRAASRPLGVRDVASQAGLHPNTARFHLERLTEAGLAERAPGGTGGPGRPRMLYRAMAGPDRGQRSYRLLATMLASLVAAMLPDPGAAALAAGREWGRYLTDRPTPLERVSAVAAAHRLTAVLTGLGFGAELAPGAELALRAAPEPGTQPGPGPRPRPGTRPEPATHPRLEHGAERVPGGKPGHGAERVPGGEPGHGAERVRGGAAPLLRLGHCPFREVAQEHQSVVCALHLGLMQGALSELRAPLAAERLEPFAEPELCLGYLRATRSPANSVAAR